VLQTAWTYFLAICLLEHIFIVQANIVFTAVPFLVVSVAAWWAALVLWRVTYVHTFKWFVRTDQTKQQIANFCVKIVSVTLFVFMYILAMRILLKSNNVLIIVAGFCWLPQIFLNAYHNKKRPPPEFSYLLGTQCFVSVFILYVRCTSFNIYGNQP